MLKEIIIIKTNKGVMAGHPLARIRIAGKRGGTTLKDVRVGDRVQGSYIVTNVTYEVEEV